MTRHALFCGHRSRFCFSLPPFSRDVFYKRLAFSRRFVLPSTPNGATRKRLYHDREIFRQTSSSATREPARNFAVYEELINAVCAVCADEKCCLRSSFENFSVGLKICGLNDTFCKSKYWTCVRHASSSATLPRGKIENNTCILFLYFVQGKCEQRAQSADRFSRQDCRHSSDFSFPVNYNYFKRGCLFFKVYPQIREREFHRNVQINICLK